MRVPVGAVMLLRVAVRDLALCSESDVRRKIVRLCRLERSPGLKPLEFAGFFAGLKPCTPTERHKTSVFSAACKATVETIELSARLKSRPFKTTTFQHSLQPLAGETNLRLSILDYGDALLFFADE